MASSVIAVPKSTATQGQPYFSARGRGVHDAVRPHFLRVIDADRDSRRRIRIDVQRAQAEMARGHAVHRGARLRNHRGYDHAVHLGHIERAEREEIAEEHAPAVDGLERVRFEPPIGQPLGAVEQPQRQVCVADVNR